MECTSEGDSDASDNEDHAADHEKAPDNAEKRDSDSFRQRSQIIREEYNCVRRRSQLAAEASQEADVFRRRSKLAIQGSQAEVLQAVETRRNSARVSMVVAEKGGDHPRLSSKEKEGSAQAGAAKDRRRSVKGNANANTGHRAARKHAQASQSGSNSFGKAMNQSARTMYDAVHSLYRSVPPGGAGQETKGGDTTIPKEGSKEKLSDGGRRQSVHGNDEPHEPPVHTRARADSSPSATSDSNSSDSDGTNRKHRYGATDGSSSESTHSETYDFRQAAMKVNDLLDALNSDTRTDILTDLNCWYGARKNAVEEDLHDLNAVNSDHQHREEEIKMSMAHMLQRFEDKQMREVKVLVNCHRTLNLGARGQLKKRKRFAKSLSIKSPRTSPKASKSSKKSPKSPGSPLSPKSPKSEGAEKDLNDERSARKASAVSPSGKLESIADSLAEERALSIHSGSTPSDGHADSNDDEQDGEDAEENHSEIGIEEGPENLEADVDDPSGSKKLEEGLDIEAARKKLKEMYDLPHTVLARLNSDEPPAAEVLQALATVQEGHLQLERRAQLAKKACEISKMALEYTMEGIPEKADGAVQELIQQVRIEVFGENGECEVIGPDPEELEEECRALEGLIKKQEKEMNALSKARERTMKLEQDMAEHLSYEHDSDDDREAPMTMSKSEPSAKSDDNSKSPPRSQIDAKAKASTIQNRSRNSRLTKSQTLNLDRATAAIESAHAEGVQQSMQTLSQAGPTVPSWQSNHQIQLLQEKIAEKETKIGKAREVQKRMKKELAVFRYCAQKAKLGLNAFEEEFDPSTIEGNSESSGSSSDDDKPHSHPGGLGAKAALTTQRSASKLLVPVHGRQSFSADTRQSQEGSLQGTLVLSALVPDDSSPKHNRRGVSSATSSRSPSRSSSKLNIHEADPHGRGTLPMATVASLHSRTSKDEKSAEGRECQVHSVNVHNKKLEDAEAQMKSRIAELQVQITRDVYNLKSEKKRQNQLKKEIKRLQKIYKQMVTSHKGSPNSLEALDKQVHNLQEGGNKLRTQIQELTEELNRQQRILERAQAEAAADDVKRKEDPKTASNEVATPKGAAANSTVAASGNAMPLGSGGATASLLAGLTAFAPATKADAAAAGATNAFGMPLEVKDNAAISTTSVAENIEAAPAKNIMGASPAETTSAATPAGATDTKPSSEKNPSLTADKKKQPSLTAEESKVTPQGIRHEDLAELVRMQSTNEDYRKEIESLVQKMRQLRLTMMKNKNVISADVIREIVGASINPEDAKPPPEYWHLKKEVRIRQNEVRVLRKRWWTDHKDLDVLVEKVRHTHGIHEQGHHGHHGSMTDEPRPDLGPLRRKLAEAQTDYSQRSSLQHNFLPEQPGHEEEAEGSPKHHAGPIQRSKTQPLALGSLAAYRNAQATSKSRYRFSSDMAFPSQQQPETLAPPTGITGKTIARSSIKPDVGVELTAIRRRYSTVRKSILSGSAHTLKDLVKHED